MKKLNTFGLDSLIAIYFGQDYDLLGSGESVSAQIDAWSAELWDTTPGDFLELLREKIKTSLPGMH